MEASATSEQPAHAPPQAHLPSRYDVAAWRGEFDRRIEPYLVTGVTILDVGAGRRPTIPPANRPAGCRYIGLDLSAAELAEAPMGSYDETWVGDAAAPVFSCHVRAVLRVCARRT